MDDWNRYEVSAIVSDYFEMFVKEFSGEKYNKSVHRRGLIRLLNKRTHGAIEWKHQNISAVLIELGLLYIPGYKPADRYQNLLKDEVENYLNQHPELYNLMEDFIFNDIKLPRVKNILDAEVDIPDVKFKVSEPSVDFTDKSKPNYYKREMRNKKLGLLGEEFVIKYERQRLINLGMDSYSKEVEHISQTVGDSAGFDILSFNDDGKEKFIEVKTTQMGKDAPFYFSRNEYGFSKSNSEKYSLYRIFNFRKVPKFYQLKGSLEESSYNLPTEYLGWPK